MVLIPVLSKTPNLIKELVKVLPSITFHEVKIPEVDPHFRNSEIVICDFDLLVPYLYDLPKAKWIHGTWAGVETIRPFIQKNTPLPYQLTRYTGDHFGKIMSEYVIASIVNHERDFLNIMSNQQMQKWNRDGKISDYRVIFDLTIGIMGLGNIGSRIGKTLSMLGAKILAFGRKPKLAAGEEFAYVANYYTKETLPFMLKECDYVINILPNTIETNGLLDGGILKNCADKKSILINIGRGNIISEDSIIEAIDNKWISAAILDVFHMEPLPQTSPLWKKKGVFITPHVAGMSRAQDVAEHFKSNFNLYLKQLPLPAVVDVSKGY